LGVTAGLAVLDSVIGIYGSRSAWGEVKRNISPFNRGRGVRNPGDVAGINQTLVSAIAFAGAARILFAIYKRLREEQPEAASISMPPPIEIIASGGLDILSGPGDQYGKIDGAHFAEGTVLQPTGRSAIGSDGAPWIEVAAITPDGRAITGWIPESETQEFHDEIGNETLSTFLEPLPGHDNPALPDYQLTGQPISSSDLLSLVGQPIPA
jgi:hypothetical protein